MQNPTGSRIEDAAAEWFVRLRDVPVPEAEQAAFRAWLAADPAHAAAYEALNRLWLGLDGIDKARIGQARTPERRRRSVPRRWAVAASLALAAGAGLYAAVTPGLFADHRTTVGERRVVTLADGTRLEMNTGSAVSVAMDDAGRGITLHEGEVYLEVARDAGRPFVVDAGPGRIEVLGTAFSVRRDGGTVRMQVTESRVRVSTKGGASTMVTAGQAVSVSEASLGPVTPADPAALAWRGGRLAFDNSRLADVLAELDRYRSGRIVIMDRAVSDIPITGSFSVARPDEALATIERTLPIRFQTFSGWLVLAFPATPQ